MIWREVFSINANRPCLAIGYKKTYHSIETIAWTIEEFDNYIESFNATTKLFRDTLKKFWPMRNFEPVAAETKIPAVRARFENLRDNLIQSSEAG